MTQEIVPTDLLAATAKLTLALQDFASALAQHSAPNHNPVTCRLDELRDGDMFTVNNDNDVPYGAFLKRVEIFTPRFPPCDNPSDLQPSAIHAHVIDHNGHLLLCDRPGRTVEVLRNA